MKIVIPGGSGHIGQLLAKSLLACGEQVVIISRNMPDLVLEDKSELLEFCHWDGRTEGDWMDHIDGSDLVVNLAGRSVNCRYNEANRKEITESRVLSTQLVGKAIAKAKKPPECWMQMSTATLYEHRYDKANDEIDGIIGGSDPKQPSAWNFSYDVVKAWEKAVDDVEVPGTRKIKLRTSILMSPGEGGPFDVLLRLVRMGLGGTMGNGKQYISWISDHDFVKGILFCLLFRDIEGPVNFASPGALPNAEFMQILREVWGAKFGLPATEWMLEIGALLLQTETELILKSRRVAPGRLLEAGFEFDFPEWRGAAEELVRRWRLLEEHEANGSA